MSENTPATMPEPVKAPITIHQTVGGQLFECQPKTSAEQVELGDGTNVATRLQTLERAVSGQTTTHVVNSIADRDALTGLKAGDQCWVIDATADATVNAGGAKYLYMLDATWLKIGEAESLDVVCNWDHIEGKPASPVASIDLAVAKQHTHDNIETLAHVSDDGAGNLLFKGKRVSDGLAWAVRVNSLDEIPANLADGGLVFLTTTVAGGDEAGGESGTGN